jgi:hypothetical protein
MCLPIYPPYGNTLIKKMNNIIYIIYSTMGGGMGNLIELTDMELEK